MLLVVSGTGRDAAAIRSAAEGAITEFKANHAKVLAVVANRVEPSIVDAVEAELAKIDGMVAGALPTDPLLVAPTVGAQFEAVGATFMQGNSDLLNREAVEVLVAGMTLPNVLQRLTPESTVIMPSDRTDLLPGLLLAHASGTFPKLAALLLVGGYEIPDSIGQLIAGIHSDLPIGRTDLGTFTSAERLFRLEAPMTSSPAQGGGGAATVRRAPGHRQAARGVARPSLRGDHAADVRAPAAGDRPLGPADHRAAGGDRRSHSDLGRHHPARGAANVILLGDAVDIRRGPTIWAWRCRTSRSSIRPSPNCSTTSPRCTPDCAPTRAFH